MQTTLLGIAIAIILALVAALVGPLLIDWGQYRSIFEAEATHLLGVQVQVKGPIDARLLPSPRLTLRDIEIGPGGSDRIHADALNVEFALAPLMRGEWQATDLHLSGPQLHLGLDKAGHVKAPALAIGFKPDVLTIDRLGIDGGKVVLSDASNGNTVTLDHLYFNGKAGSLAGPFKGEGGVTVAGNQFPFRVSTGRYANDGKLRVHVTINPVQHPLAIDADGTVALHDGAPQFDGVMKVQRLVGIDRNHGKALEEPWQVSGQLKATAASALLKKAEFHYGSDDHGLKLTGVADLTFGKKSRFKAELSGRQLDLDSVLGAGDAHSAPGDAIRKLVAFAGNAFRPPIPMQFGIGIDAVTLGGGSVQNVRGDISADRSGWSLNDFEFRAPGYTQTKVSGQLAVADDGAVSFTGPAEIQSNDPNALSAWLEGRAPPKKQDLRPLSVRGDLTLGSQRIAFEHMRATFARKTITGRFAYVFAAGKQPSKLVADLNAPELDLDVALGFGKALAKGSDLARPRDMAIKADIGRATISGIEGHDVSARINVDADHWRIDKLAVADLGGASFSANGNLELKGPSPQGSLHVDLNAPDPTPVTTVLARFFPTAAKVLQARAAEMAPAKLTAQLSLAGGTPSTAKLGIDGHLGTIKLTLDGQGHVDAKQWHIGDLRLDGKLAAGDGKALVAMLGLDRYVVVGNGPGDLTVKADGSWGKSLQVSGGLDRQRPRSAGERHRRSLRRQAVGGLARPRDPRRPCTLARPQRRWRGRLAGHLRRPACACRRRSHAQRHRRHRRGHARARHARRLARRPASPARHARCRPRRRRRPDRGGDRPAARASRERRGLDLVRRAVRARRVRRLCRPGEPEDPPRAAVAADDACVSSAPPCTRARTNSRSTTWPARSAAAASAVRSRSRPATAASPSRASSRSPTSRAPACCRRRRARRSPARSTSRPISKAAGSVRPLSSAGCTAPAS